MHDLHLNSFLIKKFTKPKESYKLNFQFLGYLVKNIKLLSNVNR
jgi:hypothetical protein